MKSKIFTLLGIGFVCFSLSACANNKSESKEAKTNNVIEYKKVKKK